MALHGLPHLPVEAHHTETVQVNVRSTAFPHRNLQAVLQIKAIWDGTASDAANEMWVQSTRAAVADHLSGSYVNYIDANLAGWESAYYGENLPRLREVKQSVDPDNFWRFEQSIPPKALAA